MPRGSGVVRALSRETGGVAWEAHFPAMTSAPVVTATGILIGGSEIIWLLDVADGAGLSEWPIGDVPLAIVPVESGTFVLTTDGIQATLATATVGVSR